MGYIAAFHRSWHKLSVKVPQIARRRLSTLTEYLRLLEVAPRAVCFAAGSGVRLWRSIDWRIGFYLYAITCQKIP